MSLMTAISIWILSAACIAQSVHITWMFRQHLRLRRRVHHLEMEKEFPGYWEREHDQIERDRWK